MNLSGVCCRMVLYLCNLIRLQKPQIHQIIGINYIDFSEWRNPHYSAYAYFYKHRIHTQNMP